ncbi:helix-turn-helix domain-containing protein [Knoellia sinensis]|uniref:helix-turn-helix domain-containing protein n=1 Tax=Knoellia sinensis TaxID=136100 RepID=UPI00068A245D|nr:helix-turn-helix transcriptional regulator [Knoellia sinensis]
MTAASRVGTNISRARELAGLSQRALSRATGISQSGLSRMESGTLAPKMNEILALAWATGSTVAEITGRSAVRDRVECAARATDDADMAAMRRELTHYLELDAYLEDQAIPQPA